LAWSHGEREFIDRLSDDGEIVPELITDDTASQASVREQPLLRWKALNVRISGSGVDGAPGVRLPAREGVQYDPASRRVVASSAAGVNSAFVEAAQ
jgi:hypothetical protein